MNESNNGNPTNLWIQRARSDIRLSEVAINTQGVMYEDSCFHAQQCAEKSLKGLLSHKRIDFPRTHSIELLLDLLKKNGITVPIPIDEAYLLSQYAVETRYPGITESVNKSEAEIAIALSKQVLSWVEDQIRLG